MLTALRAYAGTGVPVFGVNYGEMGFLATVDRENAEGGLAARTGRRLRDAVAHRRSSCRIPTAIGGWR